MNWTERIERSPLKTRYKMKCYSKSLVSQVLFPTHTCQGSKFSICWLKASFLASQQFTNVLFNSSSKCSSKVFVGNTDKPLSYLLMRQYWCLKNECKCYVFQVHMQMLNLTIMQSYKILNYFQCICTYFPLSYTLHTLLLIALCIYLGCVPFFFPNKSTTIN